MREEQSSSSTAKQPQHSTIAPLTIELVRAKVHVDHLGSRINLLLRHHLAGLSNGAPGGRGRGARWWGASEWSNLWVVALPRCSAYHVSFQKVLQAKEHGLRVNACDWRPEGEEEGL
jgi:hypothetical protein